MRADRLDESRFSGSVPADARMSNAPEYMSTDSIEKITSSGESGRSGSLDVEAVEEVLDLADEDRESLPGLYRFNVVSIPRLRFVGTNLLFFVAALHNVLVFGELDLRIFLPVLIGAELYCLITWGALRSFLPGFRRCTWGTFSSPPISFYSPSLSG